MSSAFSRRTLLGAAALTPAAAFGQAPDVNIGGPAPLQNNLKHSVSRWCFGSIPLDDFAAACAAMGLKSIELLSEDEWPVVQAHGLTCACANGPGRIEIGWNDPAQHDRLVARSEELLPKVAAAGLPTMIVFSGNRNGRDDAEGRRNCAEGLRRIIPLAEELGVNVVMELLNSRRDHADYMCDHTAWGAALVDEVASPRFKLLYDIYHMQIMEGDIIATIEENIDAIAHFHTGGVPGRNEINDTQELNYRRICQAIYDTGYREFIGQEFVPASDNPLASLEEAIRICDV